MKTIYPVFLKKNDNYYLAYIPNIDRMTEGESLYDAICMARDLLGTYSLDNDMPVPFDHSQAIAVTREKADDNDFKFSDGLYQLVDIDTEDYKKKLNMKSVKKNCTIPSWLNDKAEDAGINFSRTLQDALMHQLGL